MKIVLLICFFFAPQAFSIECGEYKISGIARMIEDRPYIIVNEHSRSEYRFTIPIEEEPRLAPYIDRPLELKATIDKKMDGTKGEAKAIFEMALRLPNALSSKTGSGFSLLKKLPCQK